MSSSGFTYPWGFESDISRAGVGDATSLRGRNISAVVPSNDDLLQFNSAINGWEYKSPGEVLTITGALDNQVIRYDAINSNLQNSTVLIGDTGNITGVNDITITGNAICATAPTIGNHLANMTYVDTKGNIFQSNLNAVIDNGIARYDGTSGQFIQHSSATVSDVGAINAASFLATDAITSI